MTNAEWQKYYDELSALAEMATPGPWESSPRWEQILYAYVKCAGVKGPKEVVGSWDFKDERWAQPKIDSDFIASSRTAIPRLLDRIRKLEAVAEAAYQDTRHHYETYIGEIDDALAALEAE